MDAFDDWMSRPSIGSNNTTNSFLGSVGDFGKNAFNGTTSFLNDNSKGLGAIGGLWGAYNQYDMGNKMYDLQKDSYAYNKALSEREKKRQEDAEKAMQYGFSNSGLGAQNGLA